jgi:hypothetical protein
MIHGHAKVLDGQSTNDAARLGFCTLGLAGHDRFRIGNLPRRQPQLNVGEATLTMSRRDPPGSY